VGALCNIIHRPQTTCHGTSGVINAEIKDSVQHQAEKFLAVTKEPFGHSCLSKSNMNDQKSKFQSLLHLISSTKTEREKIMDKER